MKNPLLNRAVFIFSILGLMIAGYLWYMHSNPADIPCGGSHGCENVANSRYSRFPIGWGPPVAMYGTLGYLIIAAISILRTTPNAPARDRQLLLLSIATAVLGTLFSLYLTYAEAFLIKAWCRWCVGSQFIILIISALNITDWVLNHSRKAQSAA
jgi:uncharacterized membrane protein